MIAAELVSCLKRSLARMLFIIVSLGFGIVRSVRHCSFSSLSLSLSLCLFLSVSMCGLLVCLSVR